MKINSGIRSQNGLAVCPLLRVCVSAMIGDGLSEVQLKQFFKHTGVGNIEAVYTFPLPHKSSVTAFSAVVGETVIKGELREAEEARRCYEQALKQGDSAFLLESHRRDIFQVSLGRVMPGEEVVIELCYTESLGEVDGEIRWTLPTVVAPRYTPKHRVPDAELIRPHIGDAPYVLEFRAKVRLCCGTNSIASPSHCIAVAGLGDGTSEVTLGNEGELLDRDLILNCQTQQSRQSTLLVGDEAYRDFGYLSFVPDLASVGDSPNKRNEYIFLLDISGSMSGEKLDQAKQALRICLRNLMFGDCFNIVAFESRFTALWRNSLDYSERALALADAWIDRLSATGGTEIYEPVAHVLQSMPRKEGYNKVVFMFTDGQVGNELEVIELVRAHNRGLSFFTFGIDTAVNKLFIDGLAEAGNGMPEYIYPGERIEDKVIRQFVRIQEPYLSNVSVSTPQGEKLLTAPELPGRLYNSEAYSFAIHRENLREAAGLVVRGTCEGRDYAWSLSPTIVQTGKLFALSWAQERLRQIEALVETSSESREELLRQEAVSFSIKYCVLSAYTSFVAVHHRNVKESGVLETVVVPVCAPKSWDMEFSVHDSSHVPSPIMANSFQSLVSPSTFKAQATRETYAAPQMLSEELDMPTFLRKKRANVLQDAAALQNADGSCGVGPARVEKTSLFIIGVLTAGKDWRPYGIQLKKAAAFLTADSSNTPVKAIALHLLIKHRVYSGDEKTRNIVELMAKLSTAEQEFVQDVVSGNLSCLLAKYSTSAQSVLDLLKGDTQ